MTGGNAFLFGLDGHAGEYRMGKAGKIFSLDAVVLLIAFIGKFNLDFSRDGFLGTVLFHHGLQRLFQCQVKVAAESLKQVALNRNRLTFLFVAHMLIPPVSVF